MKGPALPPGTPLQTHILPHANTTSPRMPIRMFVCVCPWVSLRGRYGSHLPGAGEASEEESDADAPAGAAAILAEDAGDVTRVRRKRFVPGTTKVHTFFGIPKVHTSLWEGERGDGRGVGGAGGGGGNEQDG
jgi:hypothetical protein